MITISLIVLCLGLLTIYLIKTLGVLSALLVISAITLLWIVFIFFYEPRKS